MNLHIFQLPHNISMKINCKQCVHYTYMISVYAISIHNFCMPLRLGRLGIALLRQTERLSYYISDHQSCLDIDWRSCLDIIIDVCTGDRVW